jgi:hypothetical protein
MIDTNPAIAVMNDDDLLACTRELARQSCATEAELVLHLAEIDDRKLYAERAFPSMHVFCVKELGFSDGAAYNRIGVARAARRWPAVLDALRTGAVHLSGLRVLVPHFTDDSHESLLAEAAGKSKREIEEMAARLSPKSPVPDRVWRLPAPRAHGLFGSDMDSDSAASRDTTAVSNAVAVPPIRREDPRAAVAPLSEDTFKIEFTASRALRDKLREAQDLLRHRVPGGELAGVFENALDALIVKLKKERFAVGRKPRTNAVPAASSGWSRNIPDPIKRAVYERAGGHCEFVAADGRRCTETGGLEFDHVDGFARTHVHSVDGIRLACRCHNAHAAEQMYGRVFMDRMRRERTAASASAPPVPVATALPARARPGASAQQALF